VLVVLIAIIGPFVVIALWPALNFEIVPAKSTGSRLAWGVYRTSVPGKQGRDHLGVSCGVIGFAWHRQATEERRGCQTSRLRAYPGHPALNGFGWRDDRRSLFLWWRSR
jgi:hypothetical protein